MVRNPASRGSKDLDRLLVPGIRRKRIAAFAGTLWNANFQRSV